MGAIVPWFFSSDVAALVARQEPVLLNAFHVNHFLVLACLSTPLFLIAAWCWWARRTKSRRQVAFRLLALGLSLVLGLVLVEVAGRWIRTQRYVETSLERGGHWPRNQRGATFRKRPPGKRYEVTYTDAPRIQAQLSPCARGLWHRNRHPDHGRARFPQPAGTHDAQEGVRRRCARGFVRRGVACDR